VLQGLKTLHTGHPMSVVFVLQCVANVLQRVARAQDASYGTPNIRSLCCHMHFLQLSRLWSTSFLLQNYLGSLLRTELCRAPSQNYIGLWWNYTALLFAVEPSTRSLLQKYIRLFCRHIELFCGIIRQLSCGIIRRTLLQLDCS